MKKRILIVASNELIRALLETHIGQLGYAAAGVANGVEAARWLRACAADMVLVDEGVPMGGLKTARILKIHPHLQQIPVALLLDTAAPRAGDLALLQGYLCKPFSHGALADLLREQLGTALDKMPIEQVRTEIGKLSDLPVLQTAHRKLLGLLAREDEQVDMKQVVRAVEADQGLSTRVMRLCRSAFYGYRGGSVEGAVTFLGIEKMRQIAQASIVFDAFASNGNAFAIELWKHALACAAIMEAGGSMVRGRDHFIAGLLHDVGKVVLHLRFGDYFAEVRRIVEREGKSMFQAERELMGITHADIGYELARKWELPPTIASSIAFHHYPSRALQHRRLTSLVHLSDILARSLHIGDAGDAVKITMDPCAEPLAKYVFAVGRDKDQLNAQVESLISGN